MIHCVLLEIKASLDHDMFQRICLVIGYIRRCRLRTKISLNFGGFGPKVICVLSVYFRFRPKTRNSLSGRTLNETIQIDSILKSTTTLSTCKIIRKNFLTNLLLLLFK